MCAMLGCQYHVEIDYRVRRGHTQSVTMCASIVTQSTLDGTLYLARMRVCAIVI